MDKKYVWYACYGSNLLRERFMYYIEGGECELNGAAYTGCTDKSEPIEDRPLTIPHEMYFGNRSSAWEGGGVAFLKPDKDEKATTLGRMYLITEEQYKEVQKQEGLWYKKGICLGSLNGVEIMTFTNSSIYFKNLPRQKYIEVIEKGLKEAYPEMTQGEIKSYLNKCINR